MDKSNEYLADRIKWKANGLELPSEYSFYFENLTNDRKEYYSTRLKDKNIGIPTLIFTQPKSTKWTIIGTRKLVWGDNKQSCSILFSDIREIRPHSLDNLEKVKDAVNGPLPKMEWNQLTLTLENDEKRSIYSNKGQDFFAMWNILKMMRQLSLDKTG